MIEGRFVDAATMEFAKTGLARMFEEIGMLSK
jgi:hypothetical protein